MQNRARSTGFSLIELMIAVGVMGIIAAIGIPIYTDYIETARIGAMQDTIQSIRLFQEDRKLREGEYVEGTYDPTAPDAPTGLKTVLGWDPRADPNKDFITFVVECTTDGATSPECARNSGYTVTATHSEGGDPVAVTF